MFKKDNIKFILACVVMLLLAFIQCYRTVHDLHWAYEPDFDRDIGYIRNVLAGHFAQDPNIAGQYLWYNPLLYMTEAAVTKMTGLPPNIVVARAGMFLNLLSPIVFFIVFVKLFDYRVALAALLSFIFLANGNLPGWGGATYTPWLFADCFGQFIFYLNVFLCYKAFSGQKLYQFAVLGAFIGIGFLGHASPTIIMILIMVLLQGQKIIAAIRKKDFAAVKTYFIQGIVTVIPFLICSFPFLYFIAGKYHMHFVNRTILECAPGIFARRFTLKLLKVNFTIPFIIAVVGFVWFYKNYTNVILRKIILNWLYITAILYVYSSIIPTADKILHITLPDTIPAVHYFFYLKGVQSVFFGFGFIFLLEQAVSFIQRIMRRKHENFSLKLSDGLVVLVIMVYMLGYYPIYSNREDFTEPRQQAIDKENQKDDLGIYDYLAKNVPLDDVILCEYDQSLFPVMGTGIKMVSIGVYFSNPYISYDERENDRKAMISYLTTSQPSSAGKLFEQYKVNYILLTNENFAKYKSQPFTGGKVVYTNNKYTLLALADDKNI